MEHLGLIVGTYLAGGLLTLGFYLRQASGRYRNATIVAAVWPAYWLVIHGISGTILIVMGSGFRIVHSLLDHLSALVDKILTYASRVIVVYEEGWWAFYIAIALFTPGAIIYRHWASCTGLGGCSLFILQSIGWGIIWPSRVIASWF